MRKTDISELLKDQDFKDFFSYSQDKWLQNADWDEQIRAIFGSTENAYKEFLNYLEKFGSVLEDSSSRIKKPI
jgi:DNA topoisomerase VI subunit A